MKVPRTCHAISHCDVIESPRYWERFITYRLAIHRYVVISKDCVIILGSVKSCWDWKMSSRWACCVKIPTDDILKYFYFLQKKRIWHFMSIFCLGGNLHEISKPNFLDLFDLPSAEFVQKVTKLTNIHREREREREKWPNNLEFISLFMTDSIIFLFQSVSGQHSKPNC